MCSCVGSDSVHLAFKAPLLSRLNAYSKMVIFVFLHHYIGGGGQMEQDGSSGSNGALVHLF